MGTLVRTPCQNKKSREPSSQDFWQGHKWLTRRMAPPMCFPWENTLAFADSHTKTKDHRMVVFYFGRGTKARTLDTRFWRPRKKSEKSHKYAILLKMTYILTYRNRRKRGFALFRLRFLLRFALYL